MDDAWLDASQRFAADAVQSMGGRVVSIGVREVHAGSDGELIAGFDLMVAWTGHAPCSELFFVATDAATDAMQAWRYPADPLLTGLAAAVDPVEVAAVLGVSPVSLEMITLRPCSRAVVRARGDGVDVHLKVVAPGSAQSLADRHRCLRMAGVPVASVSATDDERGWVVLDTVPGRTLDECLDAHDAPLPDAEAVWSLVESLAAVHLDPIVDLPATSTLAVRHARVIAAVLPSLADRVLHLAQVLVDRSHVVRSGTVHADLHPGQLLIDGSGTLVGVLDVDGAGIGDPLDDIGRMVAHLMVTASAGRQVVSRRWRFAEQLIDTEAAGTSADHLSSRIAASLVAHATGPWRAQAASWPSDVERLVSLAEEVLLGGAASAIRRRRSPRGATSAGTEDSHRVHLLDTRE